MIVVRLSETWITVLFQQNKEFTFILRIIYVLLANMTKCRPRPRSCDDPGCFSYHIQVKYFHKTMDGKDYRIQQQRDQSTMYNTLRNVYSIDPVRFEETRVFLDH